MNNILKALMENVDNMYEQIVNFIRGWKQYESIKWKC